MGVEGCIYGLCEGTRPLTFRLSAIAVAFMSPFLCINNGVVLFSLFDIFSVLS
jgi:hypothetical protein